MASDYSNLAVCTKHFTLVGVYEGKEHSCACSGHDREWRDREWAGYDISELLAMCHLCVRDVMKSGTRWSWYACETCRQVNNRIANAILGEPSPRNQILPLGRHSMMNPVVLGLAPLASEDPLDRVVQPTMCFFEFAKRLNEWRREEGQHLVEASGFQGLKAAALNVWLAANPASAGASADAMARFIGEEDLPDIRELDELRAARHRHLEAGNATKGVLTTTRSRYGRNTVFPSMKGRELLRVLTREPLSYEVVRQSGSHRQLRSAKGYPPLTFAFHESATMPPGLVRKILTKDIGLSEEEAMELL